MLLNSVIGLIKSLTKETWIKNITLYLTNITEQIQTTFGDMFILKDTKQKHISLMLIQ